MVRSSSNESEDEGFSTDSYLSNDGHSIDESSNMGVILKKGPWTSAEDAILVDYVKQNGEGNWNAVQRHTELSRCGKSCRLRWANHLRPNLKKGAFTSEEERLIIELHAKMGNKWARMAAQLPGRTDNEIKNYWNTRVKRHYRAGLPLYPPELYMQKNQENLQNLNSPGIYGGDKGYHDLLQISRYQTSDPIFNSLNDLPYRPENSSTSASASMVNSFSPQFCTFVPQVRHDQELDESMSFYSSAVINETPTFDQAQIDWNENKKFQSFDRGLPYNPDHTKQVIPFAVNQDSHFMPNGNFSSSMLSQGAEKCELPSFQYQETDFGFGDPAPKSSDYLVESPLYGKLPSRCPSPGSSGLLDDLLYEAMAWSKSCNKLSNSTASSTINSRDITDDSAMRTCSTEFKGYSVLISPLGNSVESISNELTPSDTIDSSLEEMISEHQVKSKAIGESWTMYGERKDVSGHVDSSRPDAILGSCWLRQNAYCSKQRGPVTIPVTSILYDDVGSESYMSAGTSASSWGLNYCAWNNMPAVFQMSELP